jgi:hypothetical protein
VTPSSTTSSLVSIRLPSSSQNTTRSVLSCQACKQDHLHTYFAQCLNTNVVFSDGRAVTSDAQLWAVPDAIVARTPNEKTPENIRVPRAMIAGRADCVEGSICNENDDCYQYNCVSCQLSVPAPCNFGSCPPTAPNGECYINIGSPTRDLPWSIT